MSTFFVRRTAGDRIASMRIWLVAAALLVVFALIMTFAELQSADSLLWTGTAVHGVDEGGSVAYSFGGKSFHQVVNGVSGAPGPTPVTVYLSPSNPYTVIADNPLDRLLEGGLVLGPLLIAALLVGIGLLRTRQPAVVRHGVGEGIDPTVLEQVLERQRRGERSCHW